MARPTTAIQPNVFKPNTLKFCLTYSWLCLFRSLIKSGSGSLFLSLNFFQFQSILQLWRSSVQSHVLDPIFLTRIPDWAERWFDSPHLSPIAAGWFAKMTCELRWQKAEKLKKLRRYHCSLVDSTIDSLAISKTAISQTTSCETNLGLDRLLLGLLVEFGPRTIVPLNDTCLIQHMN